ncbi:EAL domain-containing protein [Altericista sp. CCNU0014]|uniref:EAL domain-containing protein n=1 Tax=Altericista sp. CCNU0014 TaxID=3082949 RepID=UPI00384E0E9C
MSGQSIEQALAENSNLKQQLSRQQRAEQVLLATKRRLQRLLSSSPTVIYSSQPSSEYGIIFVSASIEQFGYQPQDFLENLGLWKQCLHPEDVTYVLKELSYLPQHGHRVFEYRFLHCDGVYRWIQDRRRLIWDEDGIPVEIIGSWQDITERKQMEQALFHEKELADNVLQSIGDAVITTDATGEIQYLNPIAEQITGWRLEHAKGMPLAEVFRVVRAVSLQIVTNLVSKVRSSGKAIGLPHASVLLARNGTEYAIDGTAAPVRDRNNQMIGSVVVFRDVTQHYALARKLSWQASHDFLTGLVNRREFEQRLAEVISSAQETGQQHTLCYLDLDQFKIVNDTCGHIAGDELLRQLSVLLRRRLRTTDTLARIGGDEFGIILHDCGPMNANSITDHLLSMIQGFRFVWQNNTFSIGASIGLVSIDAESRDLNAILGAADAACYAAKEGGRNRIHVYQVDDLDLVQQRGERQWIARITKALEEKRFCLYKQEIRPIALGSSAKTHYELLLRMLSDTGEVISPMAFIPAAERYGLMTAIDRWVVSHFFSGYKSFGRDVLTEPRDLDCVYAINLSGVSISDDLFLVFLKEQFMMHEVSPQNICFEITETAAIANLSKAARLIDEIKAMGCSFALDDFGSGMSSFAYLKNLPVDYVKIDGSFIKNITNDSVDSALVECMNRIGHEIGMQTIAEFVESDSILEKLRGFGVDYAQGYGIAQPTPLNLGLVPHL